jgi:hypothetical protein
MRFKHVLIARLPAQRGHAFMKCVDIIDTGFARAEANPANEYRRLRLPARFTD